MKKFGNDYRLWVSATLAGTYVEVKGQQDLSHGGTAATIDISDKNNAPYGLSAPGNIDMPISGDIFPDLPDVGGYEVINAAFKSQAAIGIQVRKGGAAGDVEDIIFHASMFVLGNAKTYPKGGVVRAALALGLESAPIIDLLA